MVRHLAASGGSVYRARGSNERPKSLCRNNYQGLLEYVWRRRDQGEEEGSVERLLTLDEVVEYIGVSRRWLYEEARTGRLPSILIARTYRFRPEDVDRFVESFRVSGPDSESS